MVEFQKFGGLWRRRVSYRALLNLDSLAAEADNQFGSWSYPTFLSLCQFKWMLATFTGTAPCAVLKIQPMYRLGHPRVSARFFLFEKCFEDQSKKRTTGVVLNFCWMPFRWAVILTKLVAGSDECELIHFEGSSFVILLFEFVNVGILDANKSLWCISPKRSWPVTGIRWIKCSPYNG